MDSQGHTANIHEERTVRLAETLSQENVVVLRFGADLLDELNGLSHAKRLFDVVIVDCTKSGFLFTAETLLESAAIAKRLLEVLGAMVFVKSDKAVAILKESAIGLLSFQIFEGLAEIYDYSPTLARSIQSALGSRTELLDRGSDLSEQVLLACIPVLTSFGIRLKAGVESTSRRNTVLIAIDNYTPLSTIAQHLSTRMSFEELLQELKSLEESGAIFPIFAKIPFLVHCFRNQIPFKLKDYLLESKLITQDQLDGIVFSLQNTKGSSHQNVGSLCVQKGLLTSRQLEIALKDRSFYGQGGETEKVKIPVGVEEAARLQSLVGHLGTTEPAGVLQSLANNRETGVLSVEHKDMQFRALFEQGKVTRARQSKLKGNSAVTEFVSVWKEGVYVFIERQPPKDLADESCTVTRPLDKLIMDSALAADNIAVIWRRLPRGADTPLEKLADPQMLLAQDNLVDPQDGTALRPGEIDTMRRLWKELDGLISIAGTVKRLGDVTTIEAAAAINRLLEYQLVAIPPMDLSGPLEKFRTIVAGVASHLGYERCCALLRLSLQASQGYSARARMFSIGTSAEVGVDLALARAANFALSRVVKELNEWQVKFIEEASNDLDKGVLREIVYRVHDLS